MLLTSNTTKPESILNNNNNAVCYHTVSESIAMGKYLTTCIDGDDNPVDLLTKVLYSRNRSYLVNIILHDI